MTRFRKVLLVLAMAFLGVGVVQCLRWRNATGETDVAHAINFLPSLVFALSWIFLYKDRNRRSAAVVLGVISVALWGLIAAANEVMIASMAEVTAVHRYDELLDEYWGDRELVRHFPRPIPNGARNVKLSFRPAFMQGGAHMQLRMALPEQTVARLYNELSRQRTVSFFGGGINSHLDMDTGMQTTSFYTNDTEDREFPRDYEIMVFDEATGPRSVGTSWNHGTSHGVAISKKRNEVVYWAEAW